MGERNSKTSIMICYAKLLSRPRKVYYIYKYRKYNHNKTAQAFLRSSYHCYICNLNPQMQVFTVVYSRPGKLLIMEKLSLCCPKASSLLSNIWGKLFWHICMIFSSEDNSLHNHNNQNKAIPQKKAQPGAFYAYQTINIYAWVYCPLQGSHDVHS